MITDPSNQINPTQQISSSERQEAIDWLVAHNYPVLPVAPAQSVWKYHKVVPAYPEQGVWSHCPLTTVQTPHGASLQPIPLYTGKNPSYLDRTGVPHLINHRQYQNRLPNDHELEVWFTHPANGIGTLGGWNSCIWLDFDVKQFPSQEECDAAVYSILSSAKLSETLIERSHSSGWRIAVKVKQKPNFTNFSLTPGGPHVGEALFEGRFTVLAPTIGPSGNSYQSINRIMPVEVESLESIGIYPTKKANKSEVGRIKDEKTRHPSPFTLGPSVGSIPLEMLGNDTSRDILRGNYPTGVSGAQPKVDRSEALATAIQEWYGWQNWAKENGIPISGNAETLAHHAGPLLGLDCDRINRILKTIDSLQCHPAALYRGGEESCWQKIHRLDKATFEAKCPAPIKAAIVETFGFKRAHGNTRTQGHGDVSTNLCASPPLHITASSGTSQRLPLSVSVETGHGNGNGRGSGNGRCGCDGKGSNDGDDSSGSVPRGSRGLRVSNKQLHEFAAIKSQIKDILIQDLAPSELQTAKIRIRTDNPGISERELSRLFETIERELELEESRSDRRSEVDNLLKLGDQSLNLSKFLPADLAQPLKDLAQGLNIRPEVCLTSLLVAASSLHKTQTELVIHRGQGFSVPPTIFAGLVSESGQKKSPILKAIIKKPLSVLQREKREAYSLALHEYEKNIADWDKCNSEARSSKFPQGKPKLPQQRLYYFTNATGEGLLYQFQAHPDKALLALVDELVGLFASQNKYSGGRGSDRQDILSAFDGTGATVLRASGTKADIDGLLLSICGTIQPEVLKRLMRDCSDPDGQWARFLFVNQPLAAATLADDDGSGVDLTERLLDYYRAIDQLQAREYRLSREAFKRYQPVYNQLERLRVSHPNPGMRAVYSKMEGYIGRVALNLHVLYELSTGKALPDEEIPLPILEKAIALAKFYIGQVKLIHANCAADLGEMSPHLAKVVELSKRMDATTGNSWIKAKVVQSGYDSRHRPRPDAIRSWFRELEALGIGSTRGAGIRLEYSWKLPDLPFDEPDPPPPKKVEKVDKSGEKWITSPPTQTTQNQHFPTKVEKVDNPTHLKKDEGRSVLAPRGYAQDENYASAVLQGDLNSHCKGILQYAPTHHQQTPLVENVNPQSVKAESFHTSSWATSHGAITPKKVEFGLKTAETKPKVADADEYALNSKIQIPTLGSGESMESEKWRTQSSTTDKCLPQPPDSLEITHSTYPLFGCDDGIASEEAVDTISTFSPPVETVSTFGSTFSPPVETVSTFGSTSSPLVETVSTFGDCSEPDGAIKSDEATQTTPRGESFETIQSSLVTQVFPQNQSQELTGVGAPIGVKAGWKVVICTTAPSPNLGNGESLVSGDTTQFHPTETSQNLPNAEGEQFKVGDRVNWENCPSHCEQFAPFEITSLEGDYAKLDLFEKPVRLAELHPI